MKFEYFRLPNFNNPNRPWIARPLVPVVLSYGGKTVEVLALVDSGADAALFHASLAREIGIALEAGTKQTFYGISPDKGIEVYLHKIRLQLKGASDNIEMEVGFTESKGVGALVGQSGFFDHYQITFEKSKDRLEIKPARN